VWYFPHDAKWGRSLRGEIDRGIQMFDKAIVVCSENSLESIPVQREIERALQREEREKREVSFPVTLDDYVFQAWDHPLKAEILAKVIGDFREWNSNPQAYLSALDRLVKALESGRPL